VKMEMKNGRDIANRLGADWSFKVLDSFDKKVPGGTGKVFDWDLARDVAARKDIKLVIAGGLNPDNVARLVRHLQPFGVDVSGGVEASHGVKDPQKMKQFIEGARSD